ncbi:MAG: hypothetical protein WC332_01015 [Clostridia bacterium]|jgi:hypothetical protein
MKMEKGTQFTAYHRQLGLNSYVYLERLLLGIDIIEHKLLNISSGEIQVADNWFDNRKINLIKEAQNGKK